MYKYMGGNTSLVYVEIDVKHAPTIGLGIMAVSLSKLYHANSMYIII